MNLTRGFGVIAFANLVEAPLHPCAIVLYAMRVLRAQSLGEPLPAPPAAPDPAHVARAADYAGTYPGASGTALRVVADGDRLRLVDGGKTIALYPRGGGSLLGRRSEVRALSSRVRTRRQRKGRRDDLRLAVVSERALSRTARVLASGRRGTRWSDGTRNVFRSTGRYARRDRQEPPDASTGPTRSSRFRTARLRSAIRSFVSTPTPASEPQRLWIDDTPLYRVELP